MQYMDCLHCRGLQLTHSESVLLLEALKVVIQQTNDPKRISSFQNSISKVENYLSIFMLLTSELKENLKTVDELEVLYHKSKR